MTQITNSQIYDAVIHLSSEHTAFREETNRKLDALNGRVRSTEKDTVVALDRTKRIGEEVDTHCQDDDAHGGGTAKIGASAQVKTAFLYFLAGLGGGLITFVGSIIR